MKNQADFLKEALALSVENPAMKIHVCAASDELDEDSIWTTHKIEEVRICPWWKHNDLIYTDMDEIREQMEDDICGEFSDLDDLKNIIDTRIAAEVTQAICIFTKAG
jgi:hypothetical protein